MSLGLFFGGAAQGLAHGVKLRGQIDEQKEAKKTRQRAEEDRRVNQGVVLPGDEITRDYDPETAVQNAAKPPVTKNQRHGLVGKLLDKIDPDTAAAKAGLQLPQPMAAPAGAGLQQAPQPGLKTTDVNLPAGATPPMVAGGEAAGVTVMGPPKTRKATPMDTVMYRLHAARQTGDKAALASAMQDFDKVTKDEAVQELAIYGRSMSGLENMMHKLGHTLDYTEAEGGKYNVTIDGHDMGPMTLQEMNEQATEFVTKTPGYAAAAARQRSAEDRLTMAARTDAGYKSSMVEVARQNADTSEMIGRAEAARDAEAARMTREKWENQKRFTNMLFDGEGAGDAFLNANELASLGQTAYDPVTKVIQDELGNSQPVTVAPGDTIARTEIQAATRRFQASPYVKAGVIGVVVHNGRRFYQVAGQADGGYTNLDAAENAARRLHPNALKAPAQPKGK